MLGFGVAVTSAIIPGIFWLWMFTRGRSYRGTPLRMVLFTFLLGMLSVVPAGIAEYFLIEDLDYEFTDFSTVAAAMFFVVGPAEETSKFLAVRLGVFRTRHLQEPLDGLIYGAAASLGFATAENIFYALSYGAAIMIGRGPISTLGHVVFGSLWAVRFNKTSPPTRRWVFGLVGLGSAAFLHGLFDVIAFSSWSLLAIPFIVLGGWLVFRTFRRTKRASTYHLRRNVPLQVCSVCSTGFHRDDNFCPGCGNPVWQVRSTRLRCANCRQITASDAKFCRSCGDLFVFEG